MSYVIQQILEVVGWFAGLMAIASLGYSISLRWQAASERNKEALLDLGAIGFCALMCFAAAAWLFLS